MSDTNPESHAATGKDVTYDLNLLTLSDEKWNRSKALRHFYSDVFKMMGSHMRKGSSLDIGSGCGFFKRINPNITTSDIEKTKYVDRAMSAYNIHLSEERWSNVTAFDVLHHLVRPLDFLKSASDALVDNGRIVLCEPAGTPFGRMFYKTFHQEPCEPKTIQPPYAFEAGSDGMYANMGMGWGMFHRDRNQVDGALAEMNLKIKAVIFRDILAYPLTGGLSKPSLLPAFAQALLLKAEQILPQFLLKLASLRMIIVLEKNGSH